jgi:hypothetical protein
MKGSGLLLVGVFLLVGCENRQEKISCKNSPIITYANFGQAFIEHHCQSCHSLELVVPGDPVATAEARNFAPVEFEYDSAEDVWRDKDLILITSTGIDPIMPPAGGVFADDQKKLEIWLTCGQDGKIDGVDPNANGETP